MSVTPSEIDVLVSIHSEGVRPSQEELEGYDPYLGGEVQ